MRIEDAQVGTQSGSTFVFRTVHGHTLPGVGSGQQGEVIGCFGARHGAAIPAAIMNTLREVLINEDFRRNLICLRVAAGLEVACGQQVILIHNRDRVGGTDLAHAVLFFVQVVHFFVVFDADTVDGGKVSRVVQIPFDAFELHHQGFDMLVSQDGSQATPGCLLEAHSLAPGIVEREVQHAHQNMFGGASGRNDRDINLVFFIHCIVGCQFLRQQMRVFRQILCFFDGNMPFVPVDENQKVFFRLALQFQRVPSGKFKQRSEIPAGIAVNWDVGKG